MKKVIVAAIVAALAVVGVYVMRQPAPVPAVPVVAAEPAPAPPLPAPKPGKKKPKGAAKPAANQMSCVLIPPLAFCDQVKWARACYSPDELKQLAKDHPDQAKKAKACR